MQLQLSIDFIQSASKLQKSISIRSPLSTPILNIKLNENNGLQKHELLGQCRLQGPRSVFCIGGAKDAGKARAPSREVRGHAPPGNFEIKSF